MDWSGAKDRLSWGGFVRQVDWDVSKYIRVREDIENILVDENGLNYFPDEDDYEARWESYEDDKPFEEETLDRQQYLLRLKIKSLSRYFNKQLNVILLEYADSNNSIPEWTHKSGLKYYISYSMTADKYIVEGTWRMYNPTMIYFSSEEIAKKCIEKYRWQLNTVKDVSCLMGYIMNCSLSSEEMIELNYKIDKLRSCGLIK